MKKEDLESAIITMREGKTYKLRVRVHEEMGDQSHSANIMMQGIVASVKPENEEIKGFFYSSSRKYFHSEEIPYGAILFVKEQKLSEYYKQQLIKSFPGHKFPKKM